MKYSMPTFFMLIIACAFCAKANAQQPVKMPSPPVERNIFYETGTAISRKQIEGKISPEEALKLSADFRKINQVDRNSAMQRFRETGDRASFTTHDPACSSAARKIYDYLQTKNTVNESWKASSAGKAVSATPNNKRTATPDDSSGAPQQN